MHTNRWATRVLALVAIVSAAACSGPVFRAPEVTLDNVRLGGLGLSGGTVLVDLEVVNPNRFALSADRLRYDLSLGESDAESDSAWVHFAEGTFDEAFSVAPGDTANVRIPVEFTYEAVGGAVLALVRRGNFAYRATGTVDVRTPIGRRSVPFRKTGTITALDGGR